MQVVRKSVAWMRRQNKSKRNTTSLKRKWSVAYFLFCVTWRPLTWCRWHCLWRKGSQTYTTKKKRGSHASWACTPSEGKPHTHRRGIHTYAISRKGGYPLFLTSRAIRRGILTYTSSRGKPSYAIKGGYFHTPSEGGYPHILS